ncbi:interferon alpha-inducible IFI6/IFI27 family protein [Aspergillus homomorphus CBS 101889]|uniref:Uncharacterized protein n=1 Tax=Aspergillus homomorphus (strain CBS 101889) TaxID=1450537 RepID=A0A395HH38_ASPHC|nr:hypothetical protein BO97DRAFT_279640 [Aspergillus homomorphus CBS 101889]RAL06803.1 hypothetical protein BO97DRAFT_279640 [Aspergillus homomorphus CBS 101889]
MEYLRDAINSTISFGQDVAQEHKTALAVGSTGLALATAPITGPAVLGAVGFSASGPVAASFAAAWQSSLGVVQAGSLFATLQGAAMGGAAAGTFTAASNIGVGMMGSAAIGTQWTHIKNGIWLKRDGDHSDTTEHYCKRLLPACLSLKANIDEDEDFPIDTTKCMINDSHVVEGKIL